MKESQDVQVQRQGAGGEQRADVDVGKARRLVLTVPPHTDNRWHGEVIIECFVRDGRRGFVIKPNHGALVVVSLAGCVEIYTRPWGLL